MRPWCGPALLAMSLCCSSQPPPAVPSIAASPAASSESDGHTTGAHGDHTPRHGGIVYMNGDLHFEVVLNRTGMHRVYFSDATRAELPAATASEVTLILSSGEWSAETLKAEVDESGESWIAAGLPLKGRDITARVAFVIDTEPYWIDVPYLEAAETGAKP